MAESILVLVPKEMNESEFLVKNKALIVTFLAIFGLVWAEQVSIKIPFKNLDLHTLTAAKERVSSA